MVVQTQRVFPPLLPSTRAIEIYYMPGSALSIRHRGSLLLASVISRTTGDPLQAVASWEAIEEG